MVLARARPSTPACADQLIHGQIDTRVIVVHYVFRWLFNPTFIFSAVVNRGPKVAGKGLHESAVAGGNSGPDFQFYRRETTVGYGLQAYSLSPAVSRGV